MTLPVTPEQTSYLRLVGNEETAMSREAVNPSTLLHVLDFVGAHSERRSGYSGDGAMIRNNLDSWVSRSSLYNAAALPSAQPRIYRLAPTAERAVRKSFIPRIVELLNLLSVSAGKPTMAPRAADLFFVMRDYAQQSPADPAVDVVMGLHDALAADKFWVSATARQYRDAAGIIESLGDRPKLSAKHIDAAIGRLEDSGFDTTPFSAVAS